MNSPLRTLLRAATLCGAIIAVPAHAGLDIRATSATPTLTVIDLTPGDGHEAGFDVLGWTTDLQARLYTDRFQLYDRQQPPAGVPGTAQVGEGDHALTASALGPFGALDTRLRPGPYGGLQFPSTDARQNACVLLQPYSQLVVRGDAMLTAQWEPRHGTHYYSSRGWFNAALYEEFPAEGSTAFSNVELASYTPGHPQFASRDVEYTLTFANYGPDAVSLRLDLSVGSSADVSAVPEPQSLAMLAAGLCVLACRLRRRIGTALGRLSPRGRLPRLAALAACFAFAPLASADGIRGTLELSGLTLDAIDLRPADGIAARIDIHSIRTTMTATLRSASQHDIYTKEPLPGLPSDLYLGTPTAWAALRTDGSPGAFSLEVAADAGAPWHVLTAHADQRIGLMVSPYTRLAVSGHIGIAAAWEGPPSAPYANDGWVDIHLEEFRTRDGLYRNFHLEGHEFPGSNAYDDDYVLQMVNETADPMYFALHIIGSSTTYLEEIPVVPEPDALPMILAGLALCGLVAARRSGRGPCHRSAPRRRDGIASADRDRPSRRATPLRLAAALAACVAFAPHASADGIRGTIELSGLTLGAVDLRPEDGIAATVAVDSSNTALRAVLVNASGSETFVRQPPSGAPAELHLGTPLAFADLETDGTPADFSLAAVADAAAPWHIVTAQAMQGTSLVVSPYTRLSVSGHIEVAGAWEGAPSRLHANDGSIFMTLGGNQARDELSRSFEMRGREFPSSVAFEDDYLLQLVNDTAAPMTFMLNINIWTTAYLDRVPVIPEPAALPMTVAGLALCGAVAARQRGRATSAGRPRAA